jgi:hypothetical protein
VVSVFVAIESNNEVEVGAILNLKILLLHPINQPLFPLGPIVPSIVTLVSPELPFAQHKTVIEPVGLKDESLGNETLSFVPSNTTLPALAES